jgi:hypothetical protein
MKHPFQNFQVDHMTLLLQPRLYNVAYVAFHVIFGVTPEDILYEKRKEWVPEKGEESLTYAMKLGEAHKDDKAKNKTIIAVVQPSEPKTQSSHVREMLDSHNSAALWQHIALRTTDLLAFHKFATERGVQFITPILKDDEEDIIQVFSGEWYFPGMRSSGMFFEFLQRKPTPENLSALNETNKELWFRDETFLGLYGEKEREYQSGNIVPFLDFELFEKIENEIKGLKVWEISPAHIERCEAIMIEFTKNKNKNRK